jgi:F-type H+-transporting ATPase subunit epsilon
MSASIPPTHLTLEIVTPDGLLLREEVDDVVAPGQQGYFGVRPGHTPFLTTLGMGEISYGVGGQRYHMTCFWGFCEVTPDRVNVLAEIGERAEDIDVARAEQALHRAQDRIRTLRAEEGYDQAHLAYVRAVTRLAVARKRRA